MMFGPLAATAADAPFGADVSHVASEIREQTVAALASADLLPA